MKKLSKLMLVAMLAIVPVTFFGQGIHKSYLYTLSDLGVGVLQADNISIFEGGSISENQPMKFAFHLGAGWQITPVWGIDATAGMAWFAGMNQSTYFKSNVFEFNANLNFNLLNAIFGYNGSRRLELTPHVGIGQIQYASRVSSDGSTWTAGRGTGESGSAEPDSFLGKLGFGKRFPVMTVPFGGMVAFRFTDNVIGYVNGTIVYTDTDGLDCYAPAGSQYNDWYGTLVVGVKYSLGVTKKAKAEEEAAEKGAEELTAEEAQAQEVAAQEAQELQAAQEAQVAQEAAAQEAQELQAAQEAQAQEALKAQEEAAQAADAVNNLIAEKMTKDVATDIQLRFACGRADNPTNVGGNAAMQDAIEKYVKTGKATEFVVSGFASPEGGAELNDNLSQQRADNGAAYVKAELKKYAQKIGADISGIEVSTKAYGPDWKGFIEALAKSKIADKNELINSLKNANVNTMEKLVVDYMNRYEEVKNEILPSLRRATVDVKVAE